MRFGKAELLHALTEIASPRRDLGSCAKTLIHYYGKFPKKFQSKPAT